VEVITGDGKVLIRAALAAGAAARLRGGLPDAKMMRQVCEKWHDVFAYYGAVK